MRTAGRGPLGSLTATVAMALLIAGCAAGEAVTPGTGETQSGVHVETGTDTAQSSAEPDSPDGQAPSTAEPESSDEQVAVGAESAPDYANDAGQDIQVYDYPDDPEPAQSIVATLCNLNRDYISSLRPTADGVPVVDDTLRTTLVVLSDYLSHWDTLRPHYPETVPHIDTAQQVHDLWDQALLEQDNGDPGAAQSTMLTAEKYLDQLPTGELSDCKTE